ncbi:hypothetical protein A7A09_018380 [Paracoccus methylarcula]|uniref:DNA methyltransferase n=1 Tax=Paracoccus methylarcula TaxID=72022 RepID=A0A422QT67_9RHOB|nr:hypothetical protein A7A09_018380 [Paracoccus methylarcula]
MAQLVGGAGGGFAGGKAVKDSDLGQTGNLIAGAIGGLGGGSILGSMIGGDAGAGALIGQLVGGGVGGLILQVVVGLIKNKFMAK